MGRSAKKKPAGGAKPTTARAPAKKAAGKKAASKKVAGKTPAKARTQAQVRVAKVAKAPAKSAGPAKKTAKAARSFAPPGKQAGAGPALRPATENPAERMRWLEREIELHRRLYYQDVAPIISDREFDRLYTELETLEVAHPALARADSPTRQVGSDLAESPPAKSSAKSGKKTPGKSKRKSSADDVTEVDETETFPRFRHTIPVLSLSNSYSEAEALEWARKIPAPVAGKAQNKILVQWKIDGATLVLYYNKGRLERAVTRGTGQMGDDVTRNARTIANIPARLNVPLTGVVRGEVHMTFRDFQKFNDEVGMVYANPRNLSAGSLKHKNPAETARRPLRYMAFDGYFPDRALKTDEATARLMADAGLPTFADARFVLPDELPGVLAEFAARRDEVGFPVDGLVLKVDDFALREEMGFTAAHPRWATALKFEPEIAETRVRDIEVFVGRTGRVTPRAALEPVKLAGTTVQYATLHNADFIAKLGVNVGALVKISKRGEIIPAVEEVVKKGKGPTFRFPKKCPSCKSKLVREEDMVDWLCPNPLCDEKIVSRIIFFCQRKQMDIAGLGEKIVRVLFEKKYIRRLPDIFRLEEHAAEIEELDGFGEKSVRLILKGIAESKQRPFATVLPALGLKEVGPNATERLIQNGYDSIDKITGLARAPDAVDTLTSIEGIGPKTAEVVVRQFQDPEVLALIEELRAVGLNFAAAPRTGPVLPQTMAGQSWCVTGSFAAFKPREKAMDEVKQRGGRIVSGVSTQTTHLLAGEGAGSKLAKAEKLGVKIVTEAEFLALL